MAVMPVDLLQKIKDKLSATNIIGGSLEDVKFIDWGGELPPLASTEFPLIFIALDNSLHPEMRAARGLEFSYDEAYIIFITIASYVVKAVDGEGGYKAAVREASGIFKRVLNILHNNKKWDDLCYTSEAAEEDPVDWGTFPIVGGSGIAYGITIPLLCRAKSTTGSSSSSSSSSS